MSEEHGDLVEPPDVETQDYVSKFLSQWAGNVGQGVQEDCGRKCSLHVSMPWRPIRF